MRACTSLPTDLSPSQSQWEIPFQRAVVGGPPVHWTRATVMSHIPFIRTVPSVYPSGHNTADSDCTTVCNFVQFLEKKTCYFYSFLMFHWYVTMTILLTTQQSIAIKSNILLYFLNNLNTKQYIIMVTTTTTGPQPARSTKVAGTKNNNYDVTHCLRRRPNERQKSTSTSVTDKKKWKRDTIGQ